MKTFIDELTISVQPTDDCKLDNTNILKSPPKSIKRMIGAFLIGSALPDNI